MDPSIIGVMFRRRKPGEQRSGRLPNNTELRKLRSLNDSSYFWPTAAGYELWSLCEVAGRAIAEIERAPALAGDEAAIYQGAWVAYEYALEFERCEQELLALDPTLEDTLRPEGRTYERLDEWRARFDMIGKDELRSWAEQHPDNAGIVNNLLALRQEALTSTREACDRVRAGALQLVWARRTLSHSETFRPSPEERRSRDELLDRIDEITRMRLTAVAEVTGIEPPSELPAPLLSDYGLESLPGPKQEDGQSETSLDR